jgi:hypothetical protein
MDGDIKLNGAVNHSEVIATDSQQDTIVENSFPALLKQLSAGIKKEDIKEREGWRDRNGRPHFVDYVEWHTVADLLDKLTPNWSHAVRCIVQIGDFVAATAAITINGVTREGIGTGSADSEMGIKKAEHDALKRAAVKFGVARDLYRDEEKGSELSRRQDNHAPTPPPSDPITKKLSDLITPNQLGLINKLAKRSKLDAEVLCQEMYRAHLNEISRRAASALIDHLNAYLQQK